MGGAFVLGAAVLTSGIAASALRFDSLVSTVLAAYVLLVANAVVVTVALSPFRAVTRGGLAAAEAALLVSALAWWWLRGRPVPPLGPARGAVIEIARSPLAALFVVLAAAVLGYELVLALTVPPNNWDSLTYHLARAAAWAQHGGVFWIPNAPTDRINEFQPGAEEEILFLFVAAGPGRLFALPQYFGELAALVAIYGSARRLGFAAGPAVCGAALVATFSLVALEATTAQNDLVAASFPAVAACLILGGSRAELALAGLAVGIGVGVKLTTVLVWPVLALLAWPRRRLSFPAIAAGAAGGLALAGVWSYVGNLIHTGHLLGHGGGRVENSASPSFPGSLHTSAQLFYRMFDLSVLSNRLIDRLALAGLLVAMVVFLGAYRRRGPRRSALAAAAAGTPLAIPLLVIGGAAVLAYVTKQSGIPVRVPGFDGELNRRANEDYSAFGPVGTAVLIGVPAFTVCAYFVRRVDVRQLGFALAVPLFLLLLGLQASFNPFLTRFLLVPVLLTAPLFGALFRARGATAALLVVSAITVVLTLENDRSKPYHSAASHPWEMTQVQALQYVFLDTVGPAYAAYEQLVPAGACVGAVIGPDEPSYLLWGQNLVHRVLYVSSADAVDEVRRDGLSYAVISSASNGPVADQLHAVGWRVTQLGSLWLLAMAPHAGSGACSAT